MAESDMNVRKRGSKLMESSYQKALDELCDHAMQYEEDYDWEENACGGYFPMDEDSLKELRRPLQQLVNKAIPKKPYKGDWVYLCPTCNMPNVYDYEYDNKFRCCSECGQRLDWGEDDAN